MHKTEKKKTQKKKTPIQTKHKGKDQLSQIAFNKYNHEL